jgi:hypothetical protein
MRTGTKKPPIDAETIRLIEHAELLAPGPPQRLPRADLEALVHQLEEHNPWDDDRAARLEKARALLEAPPPALRTVAPQLDALPAPLRRLALEIDALWGNADGKISLQEFQRVSGYYLAAGSMFTDRIVELIELGEHLGLADAVRDLRAQLAQLEAPTETMKQARELFDLAVAEGELPGRPQALRSADLHSPRYHQLSILEHSVNAVHAMKELCELAGRDWKDPAAVMLLHDVGKVLAFNSHWGAKTFHEHDRVASTWLEHQGAAESIIYAVRHHEEMRTLNVAALEAKLGGDRDRLALMTLIYLADASAKGQTPDQLASFESELPKVRELCQRARLDAQALIARVGELQAEVSRLAQRIDSGEAA